MNRIYGDLHIIFQEATQIRFSDDTIVFQIYFSDSVFQRYFENLIIKI